MNKNKKLILIISIVLVVIILVIGVTYAAFSYSNTGSNQQLILGDIWMNYAESNSLTIEDAMPGSDYTNYFEFTILGKNTYTKKDIWYEIVLTKGDKPDDKDENYRIPDKYIKFKLVSVDSSNQETEIFTDKKYGDLTNKRVHVETIPKNTPEVNKTYRLYMTIDDSLEIGNKSSNVFTLEEWEQAFASVKVNVTGDFNEKYLPIEVKNIENFKTLLTTQKEESIIEDEDGTIYISGKQDDYNASTTDDIDFNYVWYSGKLWRITSIASDGTMKMITEDLITAIKWGADTTYETSWIREWLNQEFLPTLDNYENIIITNYKWNATGVIDNTYKIAETTMVTDPVGMLNSYENYMSYKNIGDESRGYLIIGYPWWLITPYVGFGDDLPLVLVAGKDPDMTYHQDIDYNSFGVRPSINLKSSIEFDAGDGSYNNPYIIKEDVEEIVPRTTLLNTRESGEYVQIENDRDTTRMFRIVGKELVGEKLTTKLVLNDYVKESGSVVTKPFSISNVIEEENTYWSNVSASDTTNWRGYLNTTWLETLNINMLEEGTYYLGMLSGDGYKTTVCSSVESTKSTSACINEGNVVDSTWTGYVGLLRKGEMFSSQISDYTSENASRYWVITPADPYYLETGCIKKNGTASFDIIDANNAARPTIHLTSIVVIKSGSGTKGDPFVVGLPA